MCSSFFKIHIGAKVCPWHVFFFFSKDASYIVQIILFKSEVRWELNTLRASPT